MFILLTTIAILCITFASATHPRIQHHATGIPPITGSHPVSKQFYRDRSINLEDKKFPASRLIGVGDWHGDIAAAVETLVINGIISEACDEKSWHQLIECKHHPFAAISKIHFASVLPPDFCTDVTVDEGEAFSTPMGGGADELEDTGSTTTIRRDDSQCRWIATNTIVVSTGDFLDRGPDSLKMCRSIHTSTTCFLFFFNCNSLHTL